MSRYFGWLFTVVFSLYWAINDGWLLGALALAVCTTIDVIAFKVEKVLDF